MNDAPHLPPLTPDEHQWLLDSARLWTDLCQIVPDGPTMEADLAEAASHMHALQHAVLANAAARSYPHLYRTLGGSLSALPEPHSDPEDAPQRQPEDGPTLSVRPVRWHAGWCDGHHDLTDPCPPLPEPQPAVYVRATPGRTHTTPLPKVDSGPAPGAQPSLHIGSHAPWCHRQHGIGQCPRPDCTCGHSYWSHEPGNPEMRQPCERCACANYHHKPAPVRDPEALQYAYAMAQAAQREGDNAYLRVSPTRWDWLMGLQYERPWHHPETGANPGYLVGCVKVEKDPTLTGMDWEVVTPWTLSRHA